MTEGEGAGEMEEFFRPYSVAGLCQAVKLDLAHSPGMPGTFDEGAAYALSQVKGRAERANQYLAIIDNRYREALARLIFALNDQSKDPLLSEGQLVKMTGLNRIAVRAMYDHGRDLAEAPIS